MGGDSLLIFDRDPAYLRAIQRALATEEFAIETASDPQAAYRFASETPFGVAIVTVEPGDEAAAELVRILADLAPQTEVILLSDEPGPESCDALYDLGNVYSHRRKPSLELGELGSDVVRALERRSLRRQNAYLLVELRDARDDLRSQFEFLAQVEAVAALGQMTLDSAEAMRAPLRSIEKYAGFLRGRVSGMRAVDKDPREFAEAARQLGAMEEAAGDCLSLVDDLRAFASRNSNEAPDRMTIDVGQLVRESFGLIRCTLEGRGIALQVDLADDLPPLDADRLALRHALIHLALNAIRAMPAGGCLGVRASALQGALPRVQIRVEDTGTGIPPELRCRVFEPFFTTHPFGQATGLGLFVVREAVKAAGGEIDLESEPGRGTAFTLTLPACAPVAAAA